MKNNTILISIVLAIVVGAAGFFGGVQYQKSQRPNFNAMNRGQFGGRMGMNGMNGNRMNFRPVMGEVISADEKSITVKMTDGSSKIILLPDSATVSKTDTGSTADLKVGAKVGVFGTDNSDGSVTAQTIQLNPMFRGINGSPSASPK